MNHRDRDIHRQGFHMASRGYRPAPKTNLWHTLLGKGVLVVTGAVFILALTKALL